MKQPWQLRLANYAKEHRLARPFILAFLWLGFHAAALAQHLCHKDKDLQQAPAPFLRVVALSMAMFVLLWQLPITAVPARGTDETADDSTAITLESDDSSASGSSISFEGSSTDASVFDPSSLSGPGSSLEPSSESDPSFDSSIGSSSSDTSSASSDSSSVSASDTGSMPDTSSGSSEEEEPKGPFTYVITEFAPLDELDAEQYHPVGTSLEELTLPALLSATVCRLAPTAEDRSDADGSDEGDTPALAGEAYSLPVVWQSSPLFDPETEGSYTFTPVLPEDLLLAEGVQPPTITVNIIVPMGIMPLALGDVYVDEGGNFSEDGTYQTLNDAIDAVGNNASIILLSDVHITEKNDASVHDEDILTIANKSFTIKSEEGFQYTIFRGSGTGSIVVPGTLFRLQGNAALTLRNVIIDGDKTNTSALTGTSQSSLISVDGFSTSLTISEGVKLQNNNGNWGGALHIVGGTVSIEGGSIINNTSLVDGGAIFNDSGKLTISSGDISDNISLGGNGGGIYLRSDDEYLYAIFEGNGGTISSNKAALGGGVYSSAYVQFTLNGGTFAGNTATSQGADVYAGANSLSTIIKGSIGNTSSLANSLAGGFYKDPGATVLLSSSLNRTSTNILTENAVLATLATYGTGFSTNYTERYLAANCFVSATNELSVGIPTDNAASVVLCPPEPVKVQYPARGNKADYYDTFDAAISAINAATSYTAATLSVRRDLTSTQQPQGTIAFPSRALALTIQSEAIGTTIPTVYSFASGLTFPLASLSTNQALIIDSASASVASGTGAVVISSGSFTLQSTAPTSGSVATLANTAGSAIVFSTGATGSATVAGGKVQAANSAYGLDMAGGTFSMTGGSFTTAQGARITGGTATMGGGSWATTYALSITGGSFTLQGDENTVIDSSNDAVVVSNGSFLIKGGTLKTSVPYPSNTGITISGTGSASLSGGTVTGFQQGVVMSNGSLAISANGNIDDCGGSGLNGAGVSMTGGAFTMTGGTIQNCNMGGFSGSGYGGGVYVGDGTFDMSGGSITANSVTNMGSGGGVHVAGGTFTMTGGYVEENILTDSSVYAGGVCVAAGGTFVLNGGTIRANSARYGGGVYLDGGTFTFTRGTIGGTAAQHANSATIDGGGIYVASGTLQLASSQASITGNTAAGTGGGIHIVSAASHSISAGTISGNTATAGGGIYMVAGSLALSGGTINGNTISNSSGSGGGVYLATGTALTLSSTAIISANNATGNGGGVYAAGTLTLSGGSITGNTTKAIGGTVNVNPGTGVYLSGGSLVLQGGTLGSDYQGNGVGRAAQETITLKAGFDPESTAVVLERAAANPFAQNSVFYGSETPTVTGHDYNWITIDGGLTATTAEIAPAFWAVDSTGGPLVGVWATDTGNLPYGGTMIFVPTDIEVDYTTSEGTVTHYYATLESAFEGIEGIVGTATAAVIKMKKSAAITPLAFSGSPMDVTLTSYDENTPVTITRHSSLGSGNIFTVASGQTLRFGSIIIDGSGTAGGSLVKVNGGTAVLGESTTLQNNNLSTGDGAVAYVAAGGTLTMNGATLSGNVGASLIHASGSGAVVNMLQGSVASIKLDTAAQMKLTSGTVGSLSLQNNACTVTAMNGFDAANTSVTMANSYERESRIEFLFGEGSSLDLIAAAAPCFTAKDEDDSTRWLQGGIVGTGNTREARWLPVVVTLTVGSTTTNHTSLANALAALPEGTSGSPKAGTITLLENIPTGLITVDGYRSATITSAAGGPYAISRATGVTGDMFTVNTGSALALNNVTLQGAANAGGSLVKVAGGSLQTGTATTLTGNSHTGNGGAVLVQSGSFTMDAGTTITANSAVNGGGIAVAGGNLALQAGNVVGNNATGNGGGLFLAGSGAFTLSGGKIAANKVNVSLSANGSGVYLAGGTLSLMNTPNIGTYLYENNLYKAGGTITMAGALGSAALIHVSGDAAADDIFATGNAAGANLIRHTGDELLIGKTGSGDVTWSAPALYPLYGWNSGGTSFKCATTADLLYLVIDGELLNYTGDATGDYLATKSGSVYTFTLNSDWVTAHPQPEEGYNVLASFATGYSRGNSKPIGVTIGASTIRYSTMWAAINSISGGDTATVTLYSDILMTGDSGDAVVTISDGMKVTLTSDRSNGNTATYTVMRGTTGNLFTASGSGTSLSLQNVTLDGNNITAAGSLLHVTADAQSILGSGVTLQNNTTATNGGAVLLEGTNSALTMQGGLLTGNSAAKGGGIYAAAGQLVMQKSGDDFGVITGNSASAVGGGVYLASGASLALTAGYIGTDSTDNGIIVEGNPLGSIPTPSPITICQGFLPYSAAITLEGYVTTGGTASAPAQGSDLVASFAGDFADDMTAAQEEEAKYLAATRFIYSALRGIPSSDSSGVVLADASSVQRVVDSGEPEKFADIYDAMVGVADDAVVELTLLKNITMLRPVTIGAGQTVTLSTSGNFTATRGSALHGNLFTVSGTGSLTITGNGSYSITIDGNKAATTFAQGAGGSLVYQSGGSFTLAAGATLQNNRAGAAINGGILRVTGGSTALGGGTITGGEAANGGGVYYAVSGGSIALSGNPSITANQTTGSGGGLYMAAGTLVAGGGSITANTAAASGGGVYMAGSTTLALTKGTIQGLSQMQTVSAGLPAQSAIIIQHGFDASQASVQLEGWVRSGGTAQEAYTDNAPVAGFAADDGSNSFTYAQKLAAAASFSDSSNGASPLYTNLAPTMDKLIFRQYISRTEPLYNEAASGLGSGAAWTLPSAAGAVSSVSVSVNGSPITLTINTHYTLNAGVVTLLPKFLDTLENGLYSVSLSTSGAGTIATGFMVQGATPVRLDGTVSGDYRLLASAVAAAANGSSVITLKDDVATGPITIPYGRQITITSQQPGTKTITRAAEGELFTVGSGTSLILSDVFVDGNITGFDPAGGSLVLVSGGAFMLEEDAQLTGNSTAGDGGALRMTSGQAVLAGGSITANAAGGNGGAVAIVGGELSIAGSTLSGNTAGGSGGGVAVAGGIARMDSGAIAGNTATTGNGGGVYLTQGSFLFTTNGLIENNTAAGSGGGIHAQGGTLTINSQGTATLDGNAAQNGGGIAITGGAQHSITGAVISNNTASGNGGGLYTAGSGALSLTKSDFTDNTANANGGGIYMEGSSIVSLDGGQLTGNVADKDDDGTGNGGGICVGGTASLTTANAADGTVLSITGNTADENNNGTGGSGNGVYLGATAGLTVKSGYIGEAPSGGALDPNGLYFEIANPPTVPSGFNSSNGNINLEGMADGGALAPFGKGDIVAKAPGLTALDYPAIAAIANAIHCTDGVNIQNAVAIPDANKNIIITTIEDLFDCYTVYRRGTADPDVYWHFGAQFSRDDLVEVYVKGELLPTTSYTVEDGSILLELTSDYLRQREDGLYPLTAQVDNGSGVSATMNYAFLVITPPIPPTGDGSNNSAGSQLGAGSGAAQTGSHIFKGLWSVAVASGGGVIVSGTLSSAERKRRREAKQ